MGKKRGGDKGASAAVQLSGKTRGRDSGLREHKSNPDRVLEEKIAAFQAYHRKLKLPPQPWRQLTSEDVVPDRPGFLVVVPELLTLSECASMIAAIDTVGLNQASKSDLNPRKGEAYLDRENATFSDERLSRALWDRLAPHVPAVDGREATGLFERLRYYAYRRGQRFDQHVDVAVTNGQGQVSEYTLLIYLNGSGAGSENSSAGGASGGDGAGSAGDSLLPQLEGGETIFYATAKKELVSVAPRAGMALLHAHGRRCLMHCGAPVQKGVKYLFRSDVMFPRP